MDGPIIIDATTWAAFEAELYALGEEARLSNPLALAREFEDLGLMASDPDLFEVVQLARRPLDDGPLDDDVLDSTGLIAAAVCEADHAESHHDPRVCSCPLDAEPVLLHRAAAARPGRRRVLIDFNQRIVIDGQVVLDGGFRRFSRWWRDRYPNAPRKPAHTAKASTRPRLRMTARPRTRPRPPERAPEEED